MSDTLFAAMDVVLALVIVGLLLVAFYRAAYRAGQAAEQKLWLGILQSQLRAERHVNQKKTLDGILEQIHAEQDPRQTARDSATSARSKTFRDQPPPPVDRA